MQKEVMIHNNKPLNKISKTKQKQIYYITHKEENINLMHDFVGEGGRV